MKEITNQDVYDALTHGIDVRWVQILKKDSHPAKCALCELFGGASHPAKYALCELFGGAIVIRNRKWVAAPECQGCPIYLNNGGIGCANGSTFDKWLNSHNFESALAMRNELVRLREKYFGDWK